MLPKNAMNTLNFPDWNNFKMGLHLPLDEFISKVREDLYTLKNSNDDGEIWVRENIYWLAHDHLQKSEKTQNEIDNILSIC